MSRRKLCIGTVNFGMPYGIVPESGQVSAEDAAAIVGAVRTLNEAMDDAVKTGLIVEPTFSVAQGRFEDFGISADSFIANVKVFRKLC